MPQDVLFAQRFLALTGHAFFPWQHRLFTRFVSSDFPRACDLPTGLGKTSVIAVWVLALAERASQARLIGFPRRLVYVVNRRTVVDQSTRETEAIRAALLSDDRLASVTACLRTIATRSTNTPFAISTLRGQFADNAEWREDPARAAVVVGTVDMVGSRLLFSGYGCGFKSRPLHAAFLGQDVLLVHDEAHLEPAFQRLAECVEAQQRKDGDSRTFRVMALTATTRQATDDATVFRLDDADHRHKVVSARLTARKGLRFHGVDDAKGIASTVTDRALAHKKSGERILVFLNTLADVNHVVTKLHAQGLEQQVQALTGTLRGLERDALAGSDPVFARFLPPGVTTVPPTSGTVFLVCTSAGEVGINITADQMVCDLVPFERMAQRLGRVNRFGEGDAHIDVVHVTSKGEDTGDYEQRCKLTHTLLLDLPSRRDRFKDASPRALGALPADRRAAAFSPAPVVLDVTDFLFDAWALTSIRQRLPGRPPVARYLHGVTPWQPPEAHVAWRQEVEVVAGDVASRYAPEDLLEDFPLKPHEMIRDDARRVRRELEAISARVPTTPVWLVSSDGAVQVRPLNVLLEDTSAGDLDESTVLLPPGAGGLRQGRLDGESPHTAGVLYDVADEWRDEQGAPRRLRVWGDVRQPGMRLVRVVEVRRGADGLADDGDDAPTRWCWYVRARSADDDGSRTAEQRQLLGAHGSTAEAFARRLADRLGLAGVEAVAVTQAGRWHDLGKQRGVWQRSIGNAAYPGTVLAKSGGTSRLLDLSGYRHELGSLADVSQLPDALALDEKTQDLVLHLIAAHHGRARPHFPEAECFDPERPDESISSIVRDVPRRYGRLQCRYGRWGLAFLESIVRAADILASQQKTDGSSADPADASEEAR